MRLASARCGRNDHDLLDTLHLSKQCVLRLGPPSVDRLISDNMFSDGQSNVLTTAKLSRGFRVHGHRIVFHAVIIHHIR